MFSYTSQGEAASYEKIFKETFQMLNNDATNQTGS